MRYKLLLWPHANSRYQSETMGLAEAELRLTLDRVAPEAQISADADAVLPGLTLDAPSPLDDRALEALRGHSLLYVLFESRPDGSLVPLAGRRPAWLGEDLPGILKYKGKTNEMFLQLLLNAGLYAGDFWRSDAPLAFLDPMCGRATSLFVAANRGWSAVGADVDRADLKEAERFFKRYLEYHRFKHASGRESRTLRGGGSAAATRFTFADTPEHYRAGRTADLRLFALDAARVGEAFGRDAFHLIACDLPYGVRHDVRLPQGASRSGNWLETLLASALPGWREALKPGGTIAVSFNAQTLRLDRVRALMEEAGLAVARGGPYDRFSHWVEQAITRDVAVCKKNR